MIILMENENVISTEICLPKYNRKTFSDARIIFLNYIILRRVKYVSKAIVNARKTL